MEMVELIDRFMKKISEDPAIGPTHISLYLAVLCNFKEQQYQNPISIYSRNLMKQAKISAIGTYYKCLNDLVTDGYIGYTPSYNPFLGSLIYLLNN
jgi:hypothetical protein